MSAQNVISCEGKERGRERGGEGGTERGTERRRRKEEGREGWREGGSEPMLYLCTVTVGRERLLKKILP